MDGWMDGWLGFYSILSTAFQRYRQLNFTDYVKKRIAFHK